MTAQLPPRAERDDLRREAGALFGVERRTLESLLDWADEQEESGLLTLADIARSGAEIDVRLAEIRARFGLDEGPARRALAALVDALNNGWPLPMTEAEAVLVRGAGDFAGPWRIRHATHPHLLQLYIARPCGELYWSAPQIPAREPAPLFTKLGPASEPGTARHAQRLHGGVICRVKGGTQ